MSEPKITRKKLADYKQAANNPNQHTERGLQAIEDSINYNGAGRSGLATKDGVLLAGNGTYEAMARAGIEDVIEIEIDGRQWVVVKRSDLDEDDARAKALMIADNRAQTLDYREDSAVVAALLADIAQQDAALVRAAGYNDGELRTLLQSVTEPAADPGAQIDRAEELQQKWQVQPGDLWEIGVHRLLCGDSTRAEDVQRIDGLSMMMVTDPPYGVKYDASWRDEAAEKGLLQFGASRTGAVSNDHQVDWQAAMDLFFGDIIYCWHAGLHASSVERFLEAAGFEIRYQIIWAKPHFVIGRGHYHTRHEPCWYAVRKGKQAHWIGGHDQDTLWQIHLDQNVAGGHSTQKPVECMARPIRNHDAPIVYDPFGGSGTTMVACEQLGRQCRMIEIEPKYCAVILERMAGMGLVPARVSN